MGLYFTAFKNGNIYHPWIIKAMNVMGIFVSYQFNERVCIKCNIFLISKENKIIFTDIIVDYMVKQYVEVK